MAQYVSKFSGENIDRAVAYYNAMQRIGRTILKVGVNADDWQVIEPGDRDEEIANYRLFLGMTGVLNVANAEFEEPPILYFLSNGDYIDGGDQDSSNDKWEGLKWELEYRCVPGLNGDYEITCYSNLRMAGTIVITAILSNAISVNDGSFDDLTVNNLTVRGDITQPEPNV